MSAGNSGFMPHNHPHPGFNPMSAMPVQQQAPFGQVPTGHAPFYASSHGSASSSSLIDQVSDHESYSSSFDPHGGANFGASSRPGPSSSSGFPCPNCGKVFARDDLLRRHLAREARALAQPSFDRQKSCYECARSKARCDLEVPTCGRCRTRGKQCMYAPRSGNPNVRKARNAGAISNMGAQMHGMTPQMASNIMPSGAPMNAPMPNQNWAMANTGFDMSGNAFMAPNPEFLKRESELDYDSQSDSEAQSWHSSASGSAFGSPRSQHAVLAEQSDSAAPNLANFSISGQPYGSLPSPARTDSPHSYSDVNLDPNAAPGPPRANSRKSSGFSRTTTNPIVTNMNRNDMAYAPEEGEDTPVVRLNQGMHNTIATATYSNPAERLQQASAAVNSAMMPPPRPPTLITSNLGNRAWPNPLPVRPGAFNNGIDLSGWLDEPVVPSPLYRMGPSLHSAISGNFAAITHSPVIETPISAKFAASLAQTMGLSTNPGFFPTFQDASQAASVANGANTSSHPLSRSLSDPKTPPQTRYDCNGQLVLPAPQMPPAKMWWVKPDQEGEVAACIAQASAAHFVSYPALIVLTDPTSPLPPFMHRKWIQEHRASFPESLASARSILAAYYVRLPASQIFVWRLISEQIKLIVASKAELATNEADPISVFGAVASLWMYLVLIIFTDESAIIEHVDAALLDEALVTFSKLSQTLLQHAIEASKKASESAVPSLATFGWIETMVRTLFASYSLLVLQRFRENAGDLREKLVDCSLILDIPLPSGAGEFEADSEADWVQAHQANQNALSEAGVPFSQPTLRQLVQFCKDTLASTPEDQREQAEAKLRELPWASTLFDNQDEFTNVVLSVAFALDDTRI